MTRRRTFDGVRPVSPAGPLRLLLAAAAPLATWFLHLNVSYLLVPASCDDGHPWFLVGLTVVALAVIATAARWVLGLVGTTEPATLGRFVGFAALALAALFALATLAVGASVLVVDPCR